MECPLQQTSTNQSKGWVHQAFCIPAFGIETIKHNINSILVQKHSRLKLLPRKGIAALLKYFDGSSHRLQIPCLSKF